MKLSVAPLFTRPALVGALPVVVALLLSGAISFSYNRLLKEYRDAVDHTFTVLSAIDTSLMLLQDAETGQRGYLITGDEPYLAPYAAARNRIPDAIAKLRGLVADNAGQVPQVDRLDQLAREKLAELDGTIALRKERGFDAARGEVVRNAGKETMDTIRTLAAAMQTTEHELFGSRVAHARSAERLMMGVAAVCVVLSLMGRMIATMLTARLASSAPEPPR